MDVKSELQYVSYDLATCQRDGITWSRHTRPRAGVRRGLRRAPCERPDPGGRTVPAPPFILLVPLEALQPGGLYPGADLLANDCPPQ